MIKKINIAAYLRNLSKETGINCGTLAARYHQQGLRGKELITPCKPTKLYCGKKLSEWAKLISEKLGRKIDARALRHSFYKQGTHEEILLKIFKHYRV